MSTDPMEAAIDVIAQFSALAAASAMAEALARRYPHDRDAVEAARQARQGYDQLRPKAVAALRAAIGGAA